MSYSIKRAAVIGAGIMGAGIAAHLANVGIPVLLLDIVPPDANESKDNSRAQPHRADRAGEGASRPSPPRRSIPRSRRGSSPSATPRTTGTSSAR